MRMAAGAREERRKKWGIGQLGKGREERRERERE